MRREGRVRGNPTNKSRVTGRCRSGKTRCRGCREHPVEKSNSKSKGRSKRLAADKHINPRLAEFLVKPLIKARLPGGFLPPCVHIADDDDDFMYSSEYSEADHDADEDAVRLGVFVATINSMIEAAFTSLQGDQYWEMAVDDNERAPDVAAACINYELATELAIAGAAANLHSELEMFENAARSSAGISWSDGSWSDVELLEMESCSVDDEWSLVDDGEDEV